MYSIELFTGAGGLALGTHRAGFHHLAVVERDHASCETLRLNKERRQTTGVDWPIFEQDVTKFSYEQFQRVQLDLLAGGAPCQPFSLGGKHAGEADPRNMFPQVFRAVRALRPRAVLLENVRGLVRENFKPYFEYILDQLRFPRVEKRPEESWWEHAERIDLVRHNAESLPADERYAVGYRLYNVADFGIPQERHRVFVVGFRCDLPTKWAFPEPTHSKDALLYAQYVDGSYWEEHGLPAREAPEHLAKTIARLAKHPKPLLPRWRTVRDAISDLPAPVNYVAHPQYDNHVGIPDARTYPGHTGSPWDWPAKAIKAGDHGNPGGENMLRDDDGAVRYFTVRELARLQTFPDEWHFATSWTESRRQLGNAVPMEMAKILAEYVHNELQAHYNRQRLVAAHEAVIPSYSFH